jgi:hypothetical protein
MFVDRVDVVDPDRHLDALVRSVVVTLRSREIAPAATALAVLAEEYLALAGADAPKCGRITPVSGLRPTELFEPGEALLYV